MQTIVLIPGDGIGQEVIPAARDVLVSMRLPLIFHEAEAGYTTFERCRDALPSETLTACEASDAILFGATQSPMSKVEGYCSPILTLRRHFDLFANLRPLMGNGADILIVRENTEGLYSGRERVEDGGQTAIAERVITTLGSRRVTEAACVRAMRRPRKKLTIVHKANVLKETCGLFRRVAFEVCAAFPDLTVDECLVDAAAMHMVMDLARFDVMVTTNLFGDILSDLGAGLVGGPGFAPSASIGERGPALFEPVHGSAPDIAGRGIADPRAAILSAAMMLGYLGCQDAAGRLHEAVVSTQHSGRTRETTDAIIEKVRV
jgi:homoisocitrate dehydrogenase